MYGPVNVITAHNVLGKVKPIWISQNSCKAQITKIHTIKVINNVTEFLCEYEDDNKAIMIKLCFDGLKWWVE
jgi:hypothetical protein